MNYYEILGVPKNASLKEIEAAYKKLIKEHHPDLKRNKEDKAAAEEMAKLLNEAKSVLGNPQKRKEYDNPSSSANVIIDPMKKTEAEEIEELLKKAFKNF